MPRRVERLSSSSAGRSPPRRESNDGCSTAAWDTERDVAATEALLDRCVRLAQDEAESIFDPEPLLRGDEIRRLLNLETGPEIGRLAKSLRRLQVEGALNERSEAVAWLLSEHRSSSADSAP